MSFTPKSKLPRLPREFYQGRAVVLWTHTLENRAIGWLSKSFHAAFREIMLHACSRYALVCPAYVLMPDHFHLMAMGLAERSDQHTATRFLREHVQSLLGPARLQDRAHDSVLRGEQRKRGAFVTACHYVRENPVRAGLIGKGSDWKFAGAMVPGYPDLDPWSEDFWERFWKIYARLVEAEP